MSLGAGDGSLGLLPGLVHLSASLGAVLIQLAGGRVFHEVSLAGAGGASCAGGGVAGGAGGAAVAGGAGLLAQVAAGGGVGGVVLNGARDLGL